MEGALTTVGNNPVLVLSDSQVAIMAVRKAGKWGIVETRGLREVVSLITEWRKSITQER